MLTVFTCLLSAYACDARVQTKQPIPFAPASPDIAMSPNIHICCPGTDFPQSNNAAIINTILVCTSAAPFNQEWLSAMTSTDARIL